MTLQCAAGGRDGHEGCLYRNGIKRVLDVLLASTMLLLLSPLFLALMLWIGLDTKGGVFFRHKRVGRGKRYFEILKFRTMRADAPRDVPTHLLAEPDRYITRPGRFLRRTSLDELPQLLNILKGDMSFVGPRPALWNQFDLIEARDRYGANDVPQGLTGWAQVNGRDEVSIARKAELDGEYAKKISFLFDCKCMLLTVGSVLRHRGVVEGGTGELERRTKERGALNTAEEINDARNG